MIGKLVTALVITTLLVTMTIATTDVNADRNNNPHKGNNGQCRKLQSTFPEEIQDYEGCKDTFTGKDHNDPDPLP